MTKKEALQKTKDLYLEYSKWRFPSVPDYARVYPNCLTKSSSTNGLTQCIIVYCNIQGWQAERISTAGRMLDNTKTVKDVVGFQKQIGSKKYIPSTSQKGSADISATIEGRSVKIEVKNKKTKDRQSEDQKNYQSQIDFSGGIYYVAKDFESFVTWFDENFKTNPNKLKYWEYLKTKNKDV
jgi:hypothetical protein